MKNSFYPSRDPLKKNHDSFERKYLFYFLAISQISWESHDATCSLNALDPACLLQSITSITTKSRKNMTWLGIDNLQASSP